MQIDETLLFGEEELQLQSLEIGADHVRVFAATATATAQCPICGCASSRVHSRYTRLRFRSYPAMGGRSLFACAFGAFSGGITESCG